MKFLVLVFVLLACGCSHAMRDQATSGCRSAGYLGAVESDGAWYCFKGPALTPPQPK
jgi:hypothetical protein